MQACRRDERKMTRRIDQPLEGFFRMRLVKDGPWVAARIYRQATREKGPVAWPFDMPRPPVPFLYALTYRLPPLRAEINGLPSRIERVWEFGEETTREEFDFLTAQREWAVERATWHPAANPYEAVDLNKLPTVY
jgi:hypothetical protein